MKKSVLTILFFYLLYSSSTLYCESGKYFSVLESTSDGSKAIGKIKGEFRIYESTKSAVIGTKIYGSTITAGTIFGTEIYGSTITAETIIVDNIYIGDGIGLIIAGEVDTYNDLPSAVTNPFKIYLVKTATGILFWRKSAGLWRSDGTDWIRMGVDAYTKEESNDLTNTLQSNINATNISTGTLRNETITSTATICTLLSSLGTSTGTLRNEINVSTGAILYELRTSTGTDGTGLTGFVSNATTTLNMQGYNETNVSSIALTGYTPEIRFTDSGSNDYTTIQRSSSNSTHNNFNINNKVNSGTTGDGTDLTPIMTGFTTPSGVVSSDGDYSSTYAAWKAFDSDVTGTFWLSATATPPHYIIYQFPTAQVITKYVLYGRPDPYLVDSFQTWAFGGSNNGVDYVTLHSTENIIDWINNVPKTYFFDNSTPYLYYRFYITAGQRGYSASSEIQLISTATPVNMSVNILKSYNSTTTTQVPYLILGDSLTLVNIKGSVISIDNLGITSNVDFSGYTATLGTASVVNNISVVTSGASTLPSININDSRTGATAVTGAALRVNASGSGAYALSIPAGLFDIKGGYIRGSTYFNTGGGLITCTDDEPMGWGATIARFRGVYDTNGAGDNLMRFSWSDIASGYSRGIIFSRDLDWTADRNFDGYLSPTFLMINDEGADANDYSAVEIGEHYQTDITKTHYFDFISTTGAADGSLDNTKKEIGATFRFGATRSSSPTYATNPGDVYFSGSIEVSSGVYCSTITAYQYIDLTPYPKDLQTAYDSVNSVEGKDGKLNHNKLDPFIKSKIIKKIVDYTYIEQYQSNEVQENEDKFTGIITTRTVVVNKQREVPVYKSVEEDGRNLSATVSAQNEVIKDLIIRIQLLEKQLGE